VWRVTLKCCVFWSSQQDSGQSRVQQTGTPGRTLASMMMNRKDATDAAPHMSEQRTTPIQCMVRRTELQSLLCTCGSIGANATPSPEPHVSLVHVSGTQQL